MLSNSFNKSENINIHESDNYDELDNNDELCNYESNKYNKLKHRNKPSKEKQFDSILTCIFQKRMFETMLKETQEELNKTKPCLEPYKYHTLCLHANRYNDFINHYNNLIITYDLEELNKHPDSYAWIWSWKTMKLNISNTIQEVNLYHLQSKEDCCCNHFEKNIIDKKRD